jgi:hypothetical protein
MERDPTGRLNDLTGKQLDANLIARHRAMARQGWGE